MGAPAPVILLSYEGIVAQGGQPTRVYLVATGAESETSGLLGLFRCLREGPATHQLRAIISEKKVNLDFTNPCPLLARILAHDLAIASEKLPEKAS